MAIIIDGYNLMHVTRFAVGPRDRRRFDEARNEMLAFLAKHLRQVGENDVTVAFDSEQKVSLPSEISAHGLRVLFARDYPTADDLIEELIQTNSAPNRLTVVSSDHRIQVFAKRRKATPIDSDVWFDQLLERSAKAVAAAGDSRQTDFEVPDSDLEEPFENPFPEGYGEDLG
ncbi:NYN domain-containing protein [Planctomycetota bacterium]